MLLAVVFLCSCLAAGLAAARRLFSDQAWLFSGPLGMVFGAWAVFLSSLLLGFSETSIAVASVLLVTIAWLDVRNKKIFFSLKAVSTPAAAFFAISLAAFFALSTALLHFDARGNLVGNGTDLGFYLGISSSIAHGNFLPEYPVAAGEPLSYYYFFFLFVAALHKAGLPLLLAYNALSAVFLATLFSLFFVLAQKLFNGMKAALVAVLLLLLSGGLAFMPHLQYADLADPATVAGLLSNPRLLIQYQSFGFPLQNVLARIITTKADLALLAVFSLLACFLLFGKKDKSALAVAGVFAGLSAAFNLPLAAVALSFAFFYALLADRRLDWAYFLAPAAAALALQSVLFLPKLSAASSALKLAPFWFAGGSLEGALVFWFNNLGAAGILAVIGAAAFRKQFGALFLAILPSFLLANAFSVFPWDVDNFKLVLPFQVIVALLAAAGLLWIWKQSTGGKALATVLFIASVFTGYLTLVSILHYAAVDEYARPVCDAGQVKLAEFVRANTPPKSVFIADEQADTSCLTALSGRLVYFSNMKWIENHGLDVKARRAELQKMLEGDCGSIKTHSAGFFYEDSSRGWKIPAALSSASTRIYGEGGLSVYRVSCANQSA